MNLSPDPAEVAANAQRTMKSKHEMQMAAHEARFGKLGEPMTKQQKSNLAQSISAIKNRRG